MSILIFGISCLRNIKALATKKFSLLRLRITGSLSPSTRAERWLSGRKQRFAKPSSWDNCDRGFESRSLRHFFLLFLQRFTTPKTGFLSFFALQVPQISFEPYGAFKAVWVACHFLALGVVHYLLALQSYYRSQMMFGRNHPSLYE